MRRIMLLGTVALVMAAMLAVSGTSAGAQTQTCPPDTVPGTNPLTGEPGCVAGFNPVTGCPAGTEEVRDPVSGLPFFCFGPFEEQPPPPPKLTKEACKKGGYVALGYKNQGQCIKAANQARK